MELPVHVQAVAGTATKDSPTLSLKKIWSIRINSNDGCFARFKALLS